MNDRGTKSIELRMQAMTALFIRHEIDARMMVLSEVLADTDTAMEPRVLLIPNFLIVKQGGKSLAGHQISELHGLLVRRHAAGRMTMLYAKSINDVENEYGVTMRDHIRHNYSGVKDDL